MSKTSFHLTHWHLRLISIFWGKGWIHARYRVSFVAMSQFFKFLPDLKNISILLSLVILSSGCGGSNSTILGPVEPATTVCQSGTAQILIADGFLKPTCGCIGAGESGTVYPVPANLTCHLATRTTQVFFYLWGTQLSHQIVSTGTNSFLSSPVLDSKKFNHLSSFIISFPPLGGTYEFKEVYTGMVGQFIVP